MEIDFALCTNHLNSGAPRGLGGEKGYLFSGCWGAVVIILRELESKPIILGIYVDLPKNEIKF